MARKYTWRPEPETNPEREILLDYSDVEAIARAKDILGGRAVQYTIAGEPPRPLIRGRR
jgi:hypothetical protein